jgi:hypothetical protein
MLQNYVYLQSKMLTLVAINVFEPIKKSFLKKQLIGEVNAKQFDQILEELMKENRIVLEDDHYRVTYRGMESIIPRKGRILRDIQRMEYLSQLSKKGGGI